MFKQILVSIIMVVTFGSCQKKATTKKIDIDDTYRLQESIARLSDIPDAPMQVTIQKIVPSLVDSDGIQIFCNSGLLHWDDIKNYYEQEMERIGWIMQYEYQADGIESLMIFIKPSGSLCMISLRNKQLIITKLIKNC